MSDLATETMFVFVRAYLDGLTPREKLRFLRRVAKIASNLPHDPLPLRGPHHDQGTRLRRAR